MPIYRIIVFVTFCYTLDFHGFIYEVVSASIGMGETEFCSSWINCPHPENTPLPPREEVNTTPVDIGEENPKTEKKHITVVGVIMYSCLILMGWHIIFGNHAGFKG